MHLIAVTNKWMKKEAKLSHARDSSVRYNYKTVNQITIHEYNAQKGDISYMTSEFNFFNSNKRSCFTLKYLTGHIHRHCYNT
jgi:hypothetical protein